MSVKCRLPPCTLHGNRSAPLRFLPQREFLWFLYLRTLPGLRGAWLGHHAEYPLESMTCSSLGRRFSGRILLDFRGFSILAARVSQPGLGTSIPARPNGLFQHWNKRFQRPND